MVRVEREGMLTFLRMMIIIRKERTKTVCYDKYFFSWKEDWEIYKIIFAQYESN